jgi:hypothetical protein
MEVWQSTQRSPNRGKLPARELVPKVLEGYLDAAHKDECSFSDLTAVATGGTYTTPSVIALNATYINYISEKPKRRNRRLVTAYWIPMSLWSVEKTYSRQKPCFS